MKNKEIVAMILAGGKGTRLGALTKKVAKPAVNFGGKYRIIDFPLSNCSNSQIYTVGVLTQYESIALNSYIGIGANWALDRIKGGVTILSPRETEDGAGSWYKGTADAIHQNRDFIDNYNPEYVLILSGDHIYKMDYSLMLDYHKEKGADATIAVIEVPWEETSRFGIMNADGDGTIYEFEEKPKNPKSNLASMGIYIFNWQVLKRFLMEDSKDETSNRDFGKNIIPKMLNSGKKMYAYSFNGYWKDVGTIQSLWEANMDLLDESNKLNLYDQSWKVYSDNVELPPHYISNSAVISNSLINQGCVINGEITNSIIFPGVYVGKNAKIIDSVIMPGAHIAEGSVIKRAIVDSDVMVSKNTRVGDETSKDITLLALTEIKEDLEDEISEKDIAQNKIAN